MTDDRFESISEWTPERVPTQAAAWRPAHPPIAARRAPILRIGWVVTVALCAFVAVPPAVAQDEPDSPQSEYSPASQEAIEDDAARAHAEPPARSHADGQDAPHMRGDGDASPAAAAARAAAPGRSPLRPSLDGAAQAWIALIVIVLLGWQFRSRFSWHNLDVLTLGVAGVLMLLRGVTAPLPGDPLGRTVQFWGYTLLTALALYWMVRGYRLLAAPSVPPFAPNVTPGGLAILALAGLLMSLNTIAQAPMSVGSRDGLAGGICFAETGKLPYGDAPGFDGRSPLLYLMHAGAVKVWQPTLDADGVAWSNRAVWMQGDKLRKADPTPARLVNGALFILTFGGLAWLGRRLHSPSMGLTLATIFCVFPGASECFARPEIMLPVALVTWSLAAMTLAGVGGLLSTFLLAVAGLAWPWAWLLGPAALAFFFRRGLQSIGATIGALAGVAGCGAVVYYLVAPSLPRETGALEAAGQSGTYSALMSGNQEVVINTLRTSEPLERVMLKSTLWEALLKADDIRFDPHESPATLPPGVDASTILYREIATSGAAAEALNRGYRKRAEAAPPLPRLAANLRTLAEATWLPEIPNELPIPSAWAVWPSFSASLEPAFIVARRATKIAVVALGLLTCWPLLRRKDRPQIHQVIGAMLGISAAILIASETGAAGNLAWIVPAFLAALAARTVDATGFGAPTDSPGPRPAVRAIAEPPPMPRITVEG